MRRHSLVDMCTRRELGDFNPRSCFPTTPAHDLRNEIFARRSSLSSRRRSSAGGAAGGGGVLCDAAADLALERVPACLKAEQIRLPQESTLDKIFASRWIDQGTVVFGTKDNKLALWSYATNQFRTVPLPVCPSARQLSPRGTPAHDVDMDDPQAALCGIHDIDINPMGDRLVCGADDPANMAVFAVPSFSPSYVLRGHQDWVFASRFLANDVVVSGSRDGTTIVWRLPLSQPACAYGPPTFIEPAAVLREHEQKVRCIEYNGSTNEFLTLSGDATVKVWDCNTLAVSRTIALSETRDLVAMAINEERQMVAVGTLSGTLLYDLRDGSLACSIPSVGTTWGVRCVTFNKDVLTIGGGGGSVGFYDLRNGALRRCCGNSQFIQCSVGYLRQSDELLGQLATDPPQAAYTIQYDATNTKIFVGGGPLMCGLVGCYASIWG